MLQGVHDQVVLSAPITRFSHRVIHAEEIPRLVSYAWRRATASPPGPVVLDFPIEVLFSPVRQSAVSWGSLGAPAAFPAAPHPEAIRRAVELIRASERPVIVTGSGARSLRGGDVFEKFVEASRIPVFASSKHSSPLAADAELRCGHVSSLAALRHMEHPQPDLVLILGARSGMFFGSRNASALPPPASAKYIHVDVDSAELGRIIPLDVGITSDVVTAVTALSEAISAVNYTAPEPWVKTALSLKTIPMPWEKDPEEDSSGMMHPYHALKTVFDALPSGAVITVGE